MVLQKVFAIESDAKELNSRHLPTKIQDHRILNRRVPEVSTTIRSQESDSGARNRRLIGGLSVDLIDLNRSHVLRLTF